MILSRYGLLLPPQFQAKGVLDGIATLTHLCNLYLGTSQPVSADARLAAEMYNQIFRPQYTDQIPCTHPLPVFVYKLRRVLYRHRQTKRIFNSSLWVRIRPALIRRLRVVTAFVCGHFSWLKNGISSVSAHHRIRNPRQIPVRARKMIMEKGDWRGSPPHAGKKRREGRG